MWHHKLCGQQYTISICFFLLNSFRENNMKADTDKCHLLVNSDESCTYNIEDFSIKNSTEEKLLGVNFILIFLFKIISSLFVKKQVRNYTLLHEILHYRDLNKRKRNLKKASITTQFSYCLLIWMFHCRNLNNKINWIHERALRLVYHNNLSFSQFLNLDNSITVHQKHLQILGTEIYKVKNRIAPEIMKRYFELQNPSYNLRSSCNQFRRKNKNCSLWFTVRKISWPKNLGTCAK